MVSAPMTSTARTDPSIDFETPASGTYDVWVGNYSSGDVHLGHAVRDGAVGNHPE